MRIGLLLPLNISYAPYLRIYTNILDKMDGVEYDIIYPDKKGLHEPAKHYFDVQTEDRVSKLKKVIYYYQYSRFLVRVLKQERYDKLIVFGQQVAVFIHRYLSREYKGKFIIDYRDLGLDQKCKGIFRQILGSCAHIIISSPGFKKYLPEGENYILSHNFDINILREALKDVRTEPYQLSQNKGKLEILTIGSIRDYEQNSAVIEALGNNDRYHLTFAGRGYAAADLERFAKEHHVENIVFTGYYDKSTEPDIISQTTFLNIFYPRRPTHETAISNRFYNSLIFRKPMITTVGTIQGNYTEKYNLGLAITNTDNLSERLEDYYQTFDSVEFEKQRTRLLNEFKRDYDIFENIVKKFASCLE
ncbi:MAG: capsular biosynthesis protein [Prevotella sp.]|nr:capsular biosynthesis protein [Prevotella sp.]